MLREQEDTLTKRDLDFLSDLRGLLEKHDIVCIDTDADSMIVEYFHTDDRSNKHNRPELDLDNCIDPDDIAEVLYQKRKNE